MLKNYLKIAIRNLARNKTYSAINILGLALGVACCLLLTLYIQDEVGYDKHHERAEDIYRIVTHFQTDMIVNKSGTASPPIAMTMKDEIPEVETAARAVPSFDQSLIRYEETIFYESDAYIADSTLFDVFTYELKEGNAKKALADVNSIVLSERLAQKLFGNEPALDKIISISQGAAPVEYKVTGVFKEKYNSIIKANFFTSITSTTGFNDYITKGAADQWAGENFMPSYLKLVPGHDKGAVEKKMNEVLQKHGAEQMKALGLYKTLSLELVKDVYLKSDVGQSPRINYLYVVASIAVFVLLIACINFMNLSTAKATKRAAEIGIRKTLGAFRSSLAAQILGEAMVIVVIAILISIVLVQTTLPFFNQLVDKNISFHSENILYFIAALVIVTILTGLLAGSYPAFYLSSFQPAQVLKGKLNLGSASGRLRQTLVVFQFMIAIALVCGIFIISRQVNFMMEKDLGYDARAKIVLPLRTGEVHNHYDVLKKELEKNSHIEAVSGARFVPGSPVFGDMMFYPDGGSMEKTVNIKRNVIDVGYLELLNIKLIAGRTFTDNRETEKFILNRTAVNKFGFTPEEIVGQKLYFDWQGKKYDFEVIGVMEDFNQTSLHEEIQPLLFEIPYNPNRYNYVIASVTSTNFEQTIKTIEQTWKSLINDTPFEYSFLDENVQKQYDEDKRVSRIITSFGLIAMIICALGLYGLSSYMAERRIKEIGIRKVMGASVTQIVTMMSSEFVKLVLIALVIAVPVAWYGMNKWLEDFAYKISIEWFVFAWAGAAALLIALITISFESVKSALTNPVDSLRNE